MYYFQIHELFKTLKKRLKNGAEAAVHQTTTRGLLDQQIHQSMFASITY